MFISALRRKILWTGFGLSPGLVGSFAMGLLAFKGYGGRLVQERSTSGYVCCCLCLAAGFGSAYIRQPHSLTCSPYIHTSWQINEQVEIHVSFTHRTLRRNSLAGIRSCLALGTRRIQVLASVAHTLVQ